MLRGRGCPSQVRGAGGIRDGRAGGLGQRDAVDAVRSSGGRSPGRCGPGDRRCHGAALARGDVRVHREPGDHDCLRAGVARRLDRRRDAAGWRRGHAQATRVRCHVSPRDVARRDSCARCLGRGDDTRGGDGAHLDGTGRPATRSPASTPRRFTYVRSPWRGRWSRCPPRGRCCPSPCRRNPRWRFTCGRTSVRRSSTATRSGGTCSITM